MLFKNTSRILSASNFQKKYKRNNYKSRDSFKRKFRSRDTEGGNNKIPLMKVLGVAAGMAVFAIAIKESQPSAIDDEIEDIKESVQMNLFGYNRPSAESSNCSVNILITSPAKNDNKILRLSLDKSNPSFDSKILVTGAIRSDSNLQPTDLSERIDNLLIPAGFGEVFSENVVTLKNRDIRIEIPILPDPQLGSIVSELKNIAVFNAEIAGGDSPHRLQLNLEFAKETTIPLLQQLPQEAAMLFLALYKGLNIELELNDLSEFPLFAKESATPMIAEQLKESPPEFREFMFFLKENFYYIDQISLQIMNVSFDLRIRNVDILSFVPTKGEYVTALRK